MTESTKAVLKEGTNKAEIVGVLVEKNLEEKSYTNNDGKTVESIVGSISVRTGEHEVHQIRLRANKFTNAGAENSLYKGYQTVKNEFISVADVANNPALQATVVRVNGKNNTNEYYGQDGVLKQYQGVEGRFVNRLKDGEDSTPKATFEVDIFISKVKPETDREGDETGRALVEAFIPTYSGIVPYKFAVIEQGADFFINEITKGQTIKVYGQIVNKREEHVKLVEAAFGDPIEEKTVTYVNEALIVSAAQPYDEESTKAFKPELIKERLAAREVYLETQRTKGQQQANTQPTGFGGGATTKPATSSNVPDVSKLF